MSWARKVHRALTVVWESDIAWVLVFVGSLGLMVAVFMRGVV